MSDLHDFILKNGLRIIITPDIYDNYSGDLNRFLEDNNLSTYITSASHQSFPYFAQFAKIIAYKEDGIKGVRFENGFKTNTIYYMHPDFTHSEKLSDYIEKSTAIIGEGHEIHKSIESLLNKASGLFLIINYPNKDPEFIKVPVFE